MMTEDPNGRPDAVDALPISEEGKRRLRGHLVSLAGLLLAQFPGYDFSETDLAKRSRSCMDIARNAPSENASSGDS